MSFYITHIIPESLPDADYKQISFLVSTKESYSEGIYYLGYNGSRRLTDNELSEEIREEKIIRLPKPIMVNEEKHLWVDSVGKLWTSKDTLLKDKEFAGYSGIKSNSKSEKIFSSQIQKRLPKVYNRTRLVT